MSRLNFRDLIEQLLSSIFRPVTKREILLNTVSLFFTIKYLGGGMAFMVVLRIFFRLQRTLILYPGNIPEFVLAEDILSLQKISLRFDAATDFQLDKKL